MPGPAHARTMSRSNAGFTISEFVVVVAVLALLMGIVITSVNGITRESDDRDCRTELRALKAATEQFKAQAGFYPPDDTALEVAKVLDRSETPNWRVVTKDQKAGPQYLPQGTRCRT